MFYKEMANEYIKEAILLKKHISNLRKIYSKEILLNDPLIYERISILYDMYLDLKCTGNFLELRSKDEVYGKIY